MVRGWVLIGWIRFSKSTVYTSGGSPFTFQQPKAVFLLYIKKPPAKSTGAVACTAVSKSSRSARCAFAPQSSGSITSSRPLTGQAKGSCFWDGKSWCFDAFWWILMGFDAFWWTFFHFLKEKLLEKRRGLQALRMTPPLIPQAKKCGWFLDVFFVCLLIFGEGNISLLEDGGNQVYLPDLRRLSQVRGPRDLSNFRDCEHEEPGIFWKHLAAVVCCSLRPWRL